MTEDTMIEDAVLYDSVETKDMVHPGNCKLNEIADWSEITLEHKQDLAIAIIAYKDNYLSRKHINSDTYPKNKIERYVKEYGKKLERLNKLNKEIELCDKYAETMTDKIVKTLEIVLKKQENSIAVHIADKHYKSIKRAKKLLAEADKTKAILQSRVKWNRLEFNEEVRKEIVDRINPIMNDIRKKCNYFKYLLDGRIPQCVPLGRFLEQEISKSPSMIYPYCDHCLATKWPENSPHYDRVVEELANFYEWDKRRYEDLPEWDENMSKFEESEARIGWGAKQEMDL